MGRVYHERSTKMRAPMSRRGLLTAVRALASRDPDLAGIAAAIGPPPLWEREPGFGTLIHIILEQQVSLASARAAFTRLLLAANPLTPDSFQQLDDGALRAIGFSRQKAGYCRGLAEAVASGQLDLEALTRLDDDRARSSLVRVKGIGPWTADIYLLMALRRTDIWPVGDLALAVALRRLKGLPANPTQAEMQAMAAGWRPWRAVAARLLWHYYLSGGAGQLTTSAVQLSGM